MRGLESAHAACPYFRQKGDCVDDITSIVPDDELVIRRDAACGRIAPWS